MARQPIAPSSTSLPSSANIFSLPDPLSSWSGSAIPSTAARSSNSVSVGAGENNNPLAPSSSSSAVPLGLFRTMSSHTYLMPTSPAGGRRGSGVDCRPIIKKAQGHVPACLVNASVTYCNNDQIYAFGGFDQYTDEGLITFQCNALGFVKCPSR